MTKRARQGEKAGCFTDRDGYKRAPNATGPWESGRGSGPLVPPRRTTKSRFGEYPMVGTEEYQLIRRAIKNSRWPVTPEMKEQAVLCLFEKIKDAGEDPRIQIAAIKALLEAEKQNQDESLKQRRDAVAIQNIINLGDPVAPDPEYIAWQREKLIAKQDQGPTMGDHGSTMGDQGSIRGDQGSIRGKTMGEPEPEPEPDGNLQAPNDTPPADFGPIDPIPPSS